MKKMTANVKRIILAFIVAVYCAANINAQNFDTYFTDNTLRVDYIFSGNAKEQRISVDKLNLMPKWYGKKKRLKDVPVEGNGQVIMKEHRTGNVIFRNSFSTLFQEWLSFEEAKNINKSFENVFDANAKGYCRHHSRII